MRIDPRVFGKSEDGAVAIIVALLLVIVFGFAAFAVDMGSAFNERRNLQATADLAAVSAAQDMANAQTIASELVSRNHGDRATLESLTFGHYLSDDSVAVANRLEARAQSSTDTNAVTVRVSSEVSTPLMGVVTGEPRLDVETTATATVAQLTSFRLGARVASFDPVLLNRFLNAATGSSVSLTLLDWQQLAGVDLKLAGFLDALATEANISVDGYADLLDASVSMPQVVRALASSVGAAGQTALQANLLRVASSTVSTQLPLSALITYEDGLTDLALADVLDRTEVDAFGLLRAVVDTANEGRIIDLPNLNLNIPGLTQLVGRIAIGEAQQNSGFVSVGEQGATVSTAQVRIFLRLTIAPSLLGNLGTGVSVLKVELPVYIEIGGASVTLTQHNCRARGTAAPMATFATSLNSNGTPGATFVRAFIGRFPGPNDGLTGAWPTQADFAPLVDLSVTVKVLFIPITVDLVRIEGRAVVAVGQPTLPAIVFPGTTQLPSTVTYGSKNFVGTALSSLTDNVELRSAPTGLTGAVLSLVLALLGDVQGLLRPVLATVGNVVLDPLINTLLNTLGLTLGEAELTLLDQRCRIDLVR